MKYRFEKVEKKLTPKEKRQRVYIAFSVLGVAVLVVLILYGTMWYRIFRFKTYVTGMGTMLKAGRLTDACQYVRFRDRAKATAAARWAEVSGREHVIEDMHILRVSHSPGWKQWETDLKFRIPNEGYPNLFIRATWIKEAGSWVIDFAQTFEYMPIDNSTGASVTSLLEQYSGLNLEEYSQSEAPPSEE